MSPNTYEEESLTSARAAIAKGWRDPEALRELLIWTTSTTTAAIVEEDAGDAPWAAVNELVEFPPRLLRPHSSRLEALSQHPWMYLSAPALKALQKVRADAV